MTSRLPGSLLFGRRVVYALIALAVPFLCGCTTTSLFTSKKAMPKATAKNPAVEILAIWQPAEGRGANGVPTRGFAGQFLFFTGENPSPVEVDGDVRVYLFDDRGTPEQQTKPAHQFDFDAGAWKTHLTKSALGPAYHVFIPYPRKDDYIARCSLRIRLTPTSGPTIYSESANVVLPGASDTPAAEVAKSHSPETISGTTEKIDDAEARKLIASRLGKIKRNPLSSEMVKPTDRQTAQAKRSLNNKPIATVTTSRNRTVIQTVGHTEPDDDVLVDEVDESGGVITADGVDSEPQTPMKTTRRKPNPLADDDTY